MTIGITVQKPGLDQKLGEIALNLRSDFRRIEEMRHYMLITPDSTLVAMGYTAAEVAIIKSALADADQVRRVWTGEAVQAAAQDFRLNLDQLAGMLVT
jgi:hypothetical protein